MQSENVCFSQQNWLHKKMHNVFFNIMVKQINHGGTSYTYRSVHLRGKHATKFHNRMGTLSNIKIIRRLWQVILTGLIFCLICDKRGGIINENLP